MITTLRDARRYANVAALAAHLLRDEVTGEDILALEALHVFEPDVHAGLPQLAGVLTGTTLDVGDRQATADRHRAELQVVFDKAERPDTVKALLPALFPASSHLFGGSREQASQRSWRQARRVASSDVLEIYLHASFGQDGVSTSRVLEVVRSLADISQLRTLLNEIPDGLLNDLLNHIRDYEAQFGPQDAVAMHAFLDLFPRLRLGPNFALFPSEWALEAVIKSLLEVSDRAAWKTRIQAVRRSTLAHRQLVRLGVVQGER